MLAPNVTVAGAGLLARNDLAAVMSTRTREIDTGTITTADGRVQLLQPDHLITGELADPGRPGRLRRQHDLRTVCTLVAACGQRPHVGHRGR